MVPRLGILGLRKGGICGIGIGMFSGGRFWGVFIPAGFLIDLEILGFKLSLDYSCYK